MSSGGRKGKKRPERLQHWHQGKHWSSGTAGLGVMAVSVDFVPSTLGSSRKGFIRGVTRCDFTLRVCGLRCMALSFLRGHKLSATLGHLLNLSVWLYPTLVSMPQA